MQCKITKFEELVQVTCVLAIQKGSDLVQNGLHMKNGLRFSLKKHELFLLHLNFIFKINNGQNSCGLFPVEALSNGLNNGL